MFQIVRLSCQKPPDMHFPAASAGDATRFAALDRAFRRQKDAHRTFLPNEGYGHEPLSTGQGRSVVLRGSGMGI